MKFNPPNKWKVSSVKPDTESVIIKKALNLRRGLTEVGLDIEELDYNPYKVQSDDCLVLGKADVRFTPPGDYVRIYHDVDFEAHLPYENLKDIRLYIRTPFDCLEDYNRAYEKLYDMIKKGIGRSRLL